MSSIFIWNFLSVCVCVWLHVVCVSKMIRKSVETRDWLSTLEPRNVRPVMKRVVEDVTTLDLHVGQLFEEGSRRDRSSGKLSCIQAWASSDITKSKAHIYKECFIFFFFLLAWTMTSCVFNLLCGCGFAEDSRASRRLHRQTHGAGGRGWAYAPKYVSLGVLFYCAYVACLQLDCY